MQKNNVNNATVVQFMSLYPLIREIACLKTTEPFNGTILPSNGTTNWTSIAEKYHSQAGTNQTATQTAPTNGTAIIVIPVPIPVPVTVTAPADTMVTPSPTPAPSPTESPSPPPESPAPSPAESPAASPAESPAPSPPESPAPSPTDNLPVNESPGTAGTERPIGVPTPNLAVTGVAQPTEVPGAPAAGASPTDAQQAAPTGVAAPTDTPPTPTDAASPTESPAEDQTGAPSPAESPAVQTESPTPTESPAGPTGVANPTGAGTVSPTAPIGNSTVPSNATEANSTYCLLSLIDEYEAYVGANLTVSFITSLLMGTNQTALNATRSIPPEALCDPCIYGIFDLVNQGAPWLANATIPALGDLTIKNALNVTCADYGFEPSENGTMPMNLIPSAENSTYGHSVTWWNETAGNWTTEVPDDSLQPITGNGPLAETATQVTNTTPPGVTVLSTEVFVTVTNPPPQPQPQPTEPAPSPAPEPSPAVSPAESPADSPSPAESPVASPSPETSPAESPASSPGISPTESPVQPSPAAPAASPARRHLRDFRVGA